MNSERKKWAQEKEALMHKHRQETKLNNTEKETLRGKLDSRIAIMENTNRTLNTQVIF